MILYTNMPKLKKMPNTKRQQKYMGPQTVKRVTDSHVVISQDQLGKQKEKRIPIHIARPYFERDANLSRKANIIITADSHIDTFGKKRIKVSGKLYIR